MGARVYDAHDTFVQGTFRKKIEASGTKWEEFTKQAAREGNPYIHVMVYNIPRSTLGPNGDISIHPAQLPKLGEALEISSGTSGAQAYMPPSPPKGDPKIHRYVTQVYWTPNKVKVPPISGATAQDRVNLFEETLSNTPGVYEGEITMKYKAPA
jgi:phosphatidylethanolamine-binding protein (PEBP) family uncharacterized protein